MQENQRMAWGLLFPLLGMDHAGIGSTHVNLFFTCFNIPPINEKTLKKQESEIGPVVEQVAQESCKDAARSEAAQTNQSLGGIEISYDMGWQKRGRAINSLTGVGHGISCKTNKVVAYGTRSKRCATCYAAAKLNRELTPHDCRKNFQKSSTAMETDAAGDIAKQLLSNGVEITRMVGNDDSTAIKALREQCSSFIEKKLRHQPHQEKPRESAV